MSQPMGVTVQDFQLLFEREPDYRIVLTGRLKVANPGEHLDEPLQTIHEELLSVGVHAVEVNCEELEFMNSSGLKVLIKWLSKLLKVPEEQRYHVKMVLSSEQVWQGKAFSAFLRLLPRQVEIYES